MSEWKARRFWQNAEIRAEADGFAVLLDGRPVRTPLKRPLVVPTAQLADRIAAEWQAQGDAVQPLTMPFTRSANAAIDKVADQRDEVADLIAAYGDSDLICYRAESPAELVGRQAAAWDPLIDWAAAEFDAQLAVRSGVRHRPQSPAALDRLGAPVRAAGAFHLTALHDLVSLSGSLVIALAVARRQMDAAAAWSVSRLDEDWQTERWGEDDEAAIFASERRAAFLHAAEFYEICA